MPEDDEVYFSASGDLYFLFATKVNPSPIYLTGNYVTPLHMDSESEDSDYMDEDEYDLSPDEDELLLDDDDDDEDEDEDEDEEDELDDLEQRIEEIAYNCVSTHANCSSPEPKEIEKPEPKKIEGKSKGTKRSHDDSDEAPQLVDTSAKSPEIDTTGLSKSQKKKLKKRKLDATEKAGAPVNGAERKVQFSPKLEIGPTGSTKSETSAPPPAKPAISQQKLEQKPKTEKITLANGVTIEDHATGNGPKAKNGSKLAIRYIGKLSKNGKVFDKNTKGSPFRFTLGKGEVIKGE